MSKLMYGSLCLSEINELAKKGHGAFSKGKNGKIYFNVKMWINETPDMYGNDASVLVATPKDVEEPKQYIGNLKFSELKEPQPLEPNSDEIPSDDVLPF